MNLREEIKTLPGHNTMAVNENMLNTGLLHLCRFVVCQTMHCHHGEMAFPKDNHDQTFLF